MIEIYVDVDCFRCNSSVENVYGDQIVGVSVMSLILFCGNICRTSMGKHLVCCFRIEEIDNQSDIFMLSILVCGGFDVTAVLRNACSVCGVWGGTDDNGGANWRIEW